LGSGSLFGGAILVLFALVLLNGAIVRLRPESAFTRVELLGLAPRASHCAAAAVEWPGESPG